MAQIEFEHPVEDIRSFFRRIGNKIICFWNFLTLRDKGCIGWEECFKLCHQLFNKHNLLKTLVLASSLPTICTTVLLHWLRGGCCSNDWLHSNSVGFLWLQLNLAGDFYFYYFFSYVDEWVVVRRGQQAWETRNSNWKSCKHCCVVYLSFA